MHKSISLSFYLSVYLSTYESIYLSIYVSIFLSIYLSICICICQFYLRLPKYFVGNQILTPVTEGRKAAWLVVSGSADSFVSLPPGVARLSGCLPIRLPVWLVVSGSPDASQFICLPVWLLSGRLPSQVSPVFQVIRLPVWLVSGSLNFICFQVCLMMACSRLLQSGWYCLHCSFNSLVLFICLPVLLVLSGSPNVFQFILSPLVCFPVWLMVACSLRVSLHLSPLICLPTHLSHCLPRIHHVHK